MEIVVGYWSPGFMACGAFALLLGFHVTAERYAGSFATRLVAVLARILIPVYAIGAGMLFASVLFEDGLGAMLGSGPQIIIGGLQDAAAQSDRITQVFESVIKPLGVNAFAIGFGAIAIVNLLCTHHWLGDIKANLENIQRIRGDWQSFAQDQSIIKTCNAAYVDNSYAIGDLMLWDDDRIALETSTQALDAIDRGREPHRMAIKEVRYRSQEATAFELNDGLDLKAIEKDLARLDSITIESILKTLKPFIK